MNKRIVLPAAIIAATALSGAAEASVTLDSVTAAGPNFIYSYGGTLNSDTALRGGTKLVIIDFAGYVDGSIASSLPFVTTSVRNTLPQRILQENPGITDDKSIPDLVFNFRGPALRLPGGGTLDTLAFSGLTAESIFGDTMDGTFGTLVNNKGGTHTVSFGTVGVPADPPSEADAPLSPVPEPEAWALMLVGLFGTGMTLRRSRSTLFLPRPEVV
jgi:hypothetical protein